jgi:predicted nuclease of restriction endonuclease-like (RecB) superfamily
MNKISVSIPEDFASTVNDIKLAIQHLTSSEIRQTASAESALTPIRQMPSAELGIEPENAFLSIGFSHHREILRAVKCKDEAWYYICAAARSQWSYQTLLQHLQADDYHHIGALPNNFEKTLSPMALATRAVRSFRDEYLLELVNLDNADAIHDQDVDERMLSKSLVADVEKTIQALGGSDFCFMGREKRLIYADEEIFIDLLFYHRGFHSMVAVELKMGKFRASYLGQLALYLSALDKLEKKPDENPTIGLLLCEEMNKPFVQLAVQDISKPIGIATYKTLRSIPKPYKTLAPVIEGVRQVLAQAHDRENI